GHDRLRTRPVARGGQRKRPLYDSSEGRVLSNLLIRGTALTGNEDVQVSVAVEISDTLQRLKVHAVVERRVPDFVPVVIEQRHRRFVLAVEDALRPVGENIDDDD